VKDYRELLSRGAKIAGAGAAAGALAGPGGTVVGAAVGAAVGELCVGVLDDLAKRFLSPKEQQRVGAVASLAINTIRERRHWEQIRDDGFFDHEGDTPSPAEELFEGVLLTAKQEHEQLKLPYLANFYASLVFDFGVKRSEANYLLGLAEALTYTQLCLLGLVSERQSRKFPLREKVWILGSNPSSENLSTDEQAKDLNRRQLFYRSPEIGPTAQPMKEAYALPAFTRLSSMGQRLADLMCLHMIDEAELASAAKAW
jgi:hypothetical protein